MRKLLLFAAAMLSASLSFAQNPTIFTRGNTSGTAFAVSTAPNAGANVSVVGIQLQAVTFTILGSSDGVNYAPVTISTIGSPSQTGTQMTATIGQSLFSIPTSSLTGLTNIIFTAQTPFSATSATFLLTYVPPIGPGQFTWYTVSTSPSGLSCADPTIGYVYQGTAYTCQSGTWQNPPGGSGPPSGAAAGDLSGTYPNPGVAKINGAAVPANAAAIGTNSSRQLIALTGLPPSGTAGGDLSGTYPNPGVANVNGAAIPASAYGLASNGSGQLIPVAIPWTVPSGLDPTGTTDDTAIIEAAIVSAQTNGSGVFIPCTTGVGTVCTYKIAPTGLTFLSNNAYFKCAGPNQVVLKSSSIGTAPVLTIGPGSHSGLVPNGSVSGCTFDGGNTTNAQNGIPALEVAGAIQFVVYGNTFKHADIGLLPYTSSYGSTIDNNSCGQDSTVNVCEDDEGLTGVGTGSDILHRNNWYDGVISAAYIAGNQGNINWEGGQLGAGVGTSSYNPNAAAMIWGKSYLLGTTGEVTGSITNVSFEATHDADTIQTFSQVGLKFNSVHMGQHPESGYLFNMANCGNCSIVADSTNLAGFYQNYSGATDTNILKISGQNPGNPYPFTETRTYTGSNKPTIGTTTSVNTIAYASGGTFSGTGHAFLTLGGGGSKFIGYMTFTAGTPGTVTITNPGVGYTLTAGQLSSTFTNVTCTPAASCSASGTAEFNVALGAHSTYVYSMAIESGLLGVTEGVDSRGKWIGNTTQLSDGNGNLETGGGPNTFNDPQTLATQSNIPSLAPLLDPTQCADIIYATLNTWCPNGTFEIDAAIAAAVTQLPSITVNSGGTPFTYQYGVIKLGYYGATPYVAESTLALPPCVTLDLGGNVILADPAGTYDHSVVWWQAGPTSAVGGKVCPGGNGGGIINGRLMPLGFETTFPTQLFAANSTVQSAAGQWCGPYGTTNTPTISLTGLVIGGTGTLTNNPITNIMENGHYSGLSIHGFCAGVSFGDQYNNHFSESNMDQNYYDYLRPTLASGATAGGEETDLGGSASQGVYALFMNGGYFNVSKLHTDFDGAGFSGCPIGSGGGGQGCGAPFGGSQVHVNGAAPHIEGYYPTEFDGTGSTGSAVYGQYLNLSTPYIAADGYSAAITGVTAVSAGVSATYSGTITGGGSQSYAGATILISGDVTNPGNNGSYTVISNTGTSMVLANTGATVVDTFTGKWAFNSTTAAWFNPLDQAGKQAASVSITGGIFDDQAGPVTDWVPCPTNQNSIGIDIHQNAVVFTATTNGNAGCATLNPIPVAGSFAYNNNSTFNGPVTFKGPIIGNFGFPVSIGSTSIAANSTNTSLGGLTSVSTTALSLPNTAGTGVVSLVGDAGSNSAQVAIGDTSGKVYPIVPVTSGPTTLCALHADTTIHPLTITAGTDVTGVSSTVTVAAVPNDFFVGNFVAVAATSPAEYAAALEPITAVTGTTITYANPGALGNPWVSGGTISIGCSNQSTNATSFTAFPETLSVKSFGVGTYLQTLVQGTYYSSAASTEPGWNVELEYGSTPIFTQSGSPAGGGGVNNGTLSYRFDTSEPLVSELVSDMVGIANGNNLADSNSLGNPIPVSTASAQNLSFLYRSNPTAVVSGTYQSGGSIAGTATQTCTLTAFNNGSTATATVALTGLNTIANGTALTITSQGTSATTNPTTATLGSGTATCSGTATITTVIGPIAGNAVTLYSFNPVIGPFANQNLVVAGATSGEPTSTVFSLTAAKSSGGSPVAVPVYYAGGVINGTTTTFSTQDFSNPVLTTLGNTYFGQFDFAGTINMVATYTTATITSAVVKTIINGAATIVPSTFTASTVSFSLGVAGQYYIEVNGDSLNSSLQVFANPIQTNAPSTTGAGVQLVAPGTHASLALTGGNTILYFEPGQHFLTGAGITLASGQSVYAADGAFVYGAHTLSGDVIAVNGNNVSITGRGVFDSSAQPGKAILTAATVNSGATTATFTTGTGGTSTGNTFLTGDTFTVSATSSLNLGASTWTVGSSPTAGSFTATLISGTPTVGTVTGLQLTATPLSPITRNIISNFNPGSNVVYDGFVVRDSGDESLPFYGVTNGSINNIKTFGWRLNSDGIDLVGDTNTTYTNSFLRSYDDQLTFKAKTSSGPLTNVTASNILIFESKGHAIQTGTESNLNITNEIANGIYVVRDRNGLNSDQAISIDPANTGVVSGVVYSNVQMDECLQQPFQLNTSTNGASITNSTFSNILLPTCPASPYVFMQGSAAGGITNTTFSNVTLNGAKLVTGNINTNAFVSGTVVTP